MVYDFLINVYDYSLGVIIIGIFLVIIMAIIWKYLLNRPLFNKSIWLMLFMISPEAFFPDGRTLYRFFKNNVSDPNFGGSTKIVTGEFSEATCDIATTCLEKNHSVSLITGPRLKRDRYDKMKSFIEEHKIEIEKENLKIFVSKKYENKHFVLFPNYLYLQNPHPPGAIKNSGWGKKLGKYSLSKFIFIKKFESINRNRIKGINDLDNQIQLDD